MLFKLSVKNIRKSLKDYAIYFMTLILGVAIFYIFNSLDSQQAMTDLSSSTKEIIRLMITMLGGVSVFVSCILAFLIVYANNFLIRRRKKEFGVYMTLGMGKGQISRILVGETFLIGLLSLAVGLFIGVLGAQFMSVLVVKMFEVDMESYVFVFSKTAFFQNDFILWDHVPGCPGLQYCQHLKMQPHRPFICREEDRADQNEKAGSLHTAVPCFRCASGSALLSGSCYTG